jgi:hypothetical protein
MHYYEAATNFQGATTSSELRCLSELFDMKEYKGCPNCVCAEMVQQTKDRSTKP